LTGSTAQVSLARKHVLTLRSAVEWSKEANKRRRHGSHTSADAECRRDLCHGLFDHREIRRTSTATVSALTEQ
jgi:hypothetical protein